MRGLSHRRAAVISLDHTTAGLHPRHRTSAPPEARSAAPLLTAPVHPPDPASVPPHKLNHKEHNHWNEPTCELNVLRALHFVSCAPGKALSHFAGSAHFSDLRWAQWLRDWLP